MSFHAASLFPSNRQPRVAMTDVGREFLRRVLPGVLIVALAGPALRSEESASKSRMKDILKARIAEDAKKAEARKPAPAAAPEKPVPPQEEAGATPPAPAATAESSGKESPTVLPKVEVQKSRITELDQKIAKQEQDIARERKHVKATEVDTALNDAKIAAPLAIFGGESSQFRQRVASERVQLMEAEKDILEAMKRAKTRQEKQELQKQLDEMRAVRRELEKSLR